jgi:hypothetical protein
MGRQINKEKVLEEKGELKQYILFKETKSGKLEWFLDAYKQDPYKARVLFFNNRPDCYIERDVCFERTDGSFEICCFRRTFSMTKTNRIYSREKKVKSLIYKNKKLYFKIGTNLKHAMYTDISCHFSFAYNFLLEKFAWLRNIKENKYCHNISLSSVITYKLFNADKVLKHLYKVPTAVIKVLTEDYYQINQGYGSNGYISKFDWKRISPFLTNVENLKVAHFKNHLFRDAIEMAIKLDRKINCSWSDKRLKLEHDTWAKELRKIMLEFEPIIQLNPHKIFEDFEQFTGYKMLRTNHELIEEGHKQDHCVAGYGSLVSNGHCGIYQVSGYTLEVGYRIDYGIGNDKPKKKTLHYSQLRGFRNCSAPKELDDTVKSYITAFNEKYDFDEYEKYLQKQKSTVQAVIQEIEQGDYLPF